MYTDMPLWLHIWVRTHTHAHTHTTQINPPRPSSISVCVQAFHYSISAFIFRNVGCPICYTTGNINRPTIVFREINTVEYCFSHSVSLCLSLSPQIIGALLYRVTVTQILHAAIPQNTKLEVW